MEKAFPAIIAKAQFRRVNQQLRRRAPKIRNPRRTGSSYLLSGMVRCKACDTPLNGRFAKSGKYAYYVCPSNINIRKDACETPSINARRFEELVVNKIRSNILTEGNIRALVKIVDEEMDGVAREQRKRLETVEDELEDVKRKLGRIWHLVETTDTNMADASDRIKEHREQQTRLEDAAAHARGIIAQRRKVLDDVNTIATYAQDMSRFLKKSGLTERRTFIESFVKEIEVTPDNALMRYTIPISQSTRKAQVLMGGRFGCDRVKVRRTDSWGHLGPNDRFELSQGGLRGRYCVPSLSWWWRSSDAPLSLNFWTRFTVSGDDCPYFCCPPVPSDKNSPH